MTKHEKFCKKCGSETKLEICLDCIEPKGRIKLIPVKVEWIDAHSSLDGISLSELEKEEPFLTTSCGYLVKEDEDKIVLAFMLFGFNISDEPLLKHYQVIPKGMVKKITKLKIN